MVASNVTFAQEPFEQRNESGPEEAVTKETLQHEPASDIPSNSSKDMYTRLITEAPYMPGDDTPLIPLDEIPWVDKTLIQHGMDFYRKKFTMILFGNTMALMFGFCVKPNSAVVMRTGKLDDPELSFQRYISTIQRICKFFMFPFDQDKAYKAFATVRKMHRLASEKRFQHNPPTDTRQFNEPWKKAVAHAVRKDLEHIDTDQAPRHILTWDPAVPVSQFDMALTQFGFIGTFWLFPKYCGIENRMEELKGLIHMWAINGRLLGIKDEFNLCINPDPELYDKVFRNILVESLKTIDETVVTIQSNFMKAFTKRVPFLTYKAMLFYGFQWVEGYEGNHLWGIMTITDKVSLKILQCWIWGMRNIRLFRIFCHFVTAIWMQFNFWMHLPGSVWD